MFCYTLDDLTFILQNSVTGMFYNNNNIESLQDKNIITSENFDGNFCHPSLLEKDNLCTCHIKLITDHGYHQVFQRENGESVMHCGQIGDCRKRENLAMWPSLNKSQKVQLCNTTLAMEWTVAGLYFCRYMHRRVGINERHFIPVVYLCQLSKMIWYCVA